MFTNENVTYLDAYIYNKHNNTKILVLEKYHTVATSLMYIHTYMHTYT